MSHRRMTEGDKRELPEGASNMSEGMTPETKRAYELVTADLDGRSMRERMVFHCGELSMAIEMLRDVKGNSARAAARRKQMLDAQEKALKSLEALIQRAIVFPGLYPEERAKLFPPD